MFLPGTTKQWLHARWRHFFVCSHKRWVPGNEFSIPRFVFAFAARLRARAETVAVLHSKREHVRRVWSRQGASRTQISRIKTYFEFVDFHRQQEHVTNHNVFAVVTTKYRNKAENTLQLQCILDWVCSIHTLNILDYGFDFFPRIESVDCTDIVYIWFEN